MKKSISKTLSVCLLTVLMLFCTIFFTACDNLTSSSQIEKLEKQVQGLQNERSELRKQNQNLENELNQYKDNESMLKKAMPVLANLQSFALHPSDYQTSNKTMGTTGMTSYDGIKNWQLNSVDFTRCLGDVYNGAEDKLASNNKVYNNIRYILLFIGTSDLNINENYQKAYSERNGVEVDMRYKVEITDGEMIIYCCQTITQGTNILKTVNRTYVTFANNYTINNIVDEVYEWDSEVGIKEINVKYYFGNWAYSCVMTNSSTLGTQFAQSMEDEFTKPVKPDVIDLLKFIA